MAKTRKVKASRKNTEIHELRKENAALKAELLAIKTAKSNNTIGLP
jgi:hypothetical protein